MHRILLVVAGLIALIVIGGIGYLGFSPAEMTIHSVHKDIPTSRFVKTAPTTAGGAGVPAVPMPATAMPNQGAAGLPAASTPPVQTAPAH